MGTKISVVIPCYKSGEKLEDVVFESIETIEKHNLEYEIILVNDNFYDDSFRKIQSIAAKNKNVKGIGLAKNFGQHSALMAGFNFVTGDIIVCLDDDGQCPPSEMFLLINEISNGKDVVYAKYEEKKHNAARNIGSKINSFMAEVLIGKPKDLYLSSYFACKRYVIEEAKKYENPYPYVMGLILRTTESISNVVVLHKERENGLSGYTFKKLLSLWLNGFTAFSVKPLRFATGCGIFSAIIGFIYAIYIILMKIYSPNIIIGYSSIMSVLLVLGGLIMLMLGIIGEYIGRIYIGLNNSPQFVVRETINCAIEHK